MTDIYHNQRYEPVPPVEQPTTNRLKPWQLKPLPQVEDCARGEPKDYDRANQQLAASVAAMRAAKGLPAREYATE